jgi:hypothetical protein
MWAFWECRLGARGMQPYVSWPAPFARGNLFHLVLRQIWETFRTQAAMVTWRSTCDWRTELEAMVNRAAKETMGDWPQALRELECLRAMVVIEQWLDLESERSPFTVLDCEKKHHYVQGSLLLELAIDRVDELSDGSLVLMDYKSSQKLGNPATDWQWPAMRNVQLLTYASVLMSTQQVPAALVWGKLHLQSVGFVGVAGPQIEMTGVQNIAEVCSGAADWSSQLDLWAMNVRRLAESFARGEHQNRLWRWEDVRYCAIGPLLRLHEVGDGE